jgi:hypothetical protein
MIEGRVLVYKLSCATKDNGRSTIAATGGHGEAWSIRAMLAGSLKN